MERRGSSFWSGPVSLENNTWWGKTCFRSLLRPLEWELACAAVGRCIPLPEVHTLEVSTVIHHDPSWGAAADLSVFVILSLLCAWVASRGAHSGGELLCEAPVAVRGMG